MDDVTVIDNVLRANCECGWSGVKRAGFPGITITPTTTETEQS